MAQLKGIFDIIEEEKKPIEKKLPSVSDLIKEVAVVKEGVVAPPAPVDIARIMGKPAEEVPTKPVMGMEYVPAKVAAYLVVEPTAAAASLVADLLGKGFDKLGIPKVADYFKQSTKMWKNLPFIEKIRHQTAYLREQSYKSSQTAGIIFDVSEATTRLGALLVQVGVLGKVPSLKDVPRFKTMFGHAFVTTEDDIPGRLKAAVTRVGYSITPFIAQHWGATGIKSVAIDAALNTFLTSSAYIAGFKQAQKTGKWNEFLSMAVTQFTMDIGMALSTQGYPAAQRSAAIAKHLKAHPEGQLTSKEFEAVLDSFWKAQGDKAIVVKGEELPVPKVKLTKGRGALLKIEEPRETREQLIDKLTKKNANKAPIVKAIEDAKAKPSDEAEATIKVAAESPPTREQMARIKFLVGQKGLLTPTGKQTAQHKAFLKALTGEESIMKMNQGQIQLVLETLDRWHPKTVRALYETPVKYITPELIDMLSGFREIGFIENFRDAYHVWQKIGLVREIYEATEKAEVDLVERIEADTKVALQYEKATKDTPDTFARVFRLLNKTQTKEDVSYTKEEMETAEWLKAHFDKWADDLKLPPEKRRKHYITNIIEEAIVRDLKEKNLLNTDYLRAMEYGPGAKEVFHPYLQARKGLWGKGVKEDWRTAFEAYEGYSARKLYYDPILQKISLFAKFLPPNADAYAREYKKRMTGELSKVDKQMNFTLGEMGAVIAKLPGGKGFAEFLMRGNPAGTISYHMAGLLYVSYLGLMPRSSIRNASQSALTIAEVGAKAFLKGGDFLQTAEGKKALKECVILRQRRFAALPELNVAEMRGKLKKAEDAALYLFKFPDIKFSVPRAFAAGYVEARDLGLPHDLCIRRGNEVARKCQYAYSGMASSLVSQSSAGRVLGVFTTWPRNFVELSMEWMKGKSSQVYIDYKKDTGTDVIPESGTAKRAAILRYIAIVALASVIERKTAFRATEYTGWTSLKSIPRILSGDLAGIQIPAGTVQVVLGMADYMATGDPYQMKKGWNAIRPDKQILLIKSLKDVFDGKKDWLDLLLYLEKGEGLKKYPRLRK